MQAVFPLLYAGNIQYLSLIKQHPNCCFDLGEYFEKQTFRNRCIIATANGLQSLVIPVVRNGKEPVKDVKISYADKWQLEHWRALTSAYKNSPYFEFYEDYFRPFYLDEQIETLVDFNSKIQSVLLDKLSLEHQSVISNSFVEDVSEELDFRQKFKKNQFEQFQNKSHYQVFDDRHGFLNNLSGFDLLFNLGPESQLYL